jgi:hypothetical protein
MRINAQQVKNCNYEDGVHLLAHVHNHPNQLNSTASQNNLIALWVVRSRRVTNMLSFAADIGRDFGQRLRLQSRGVLQLKMSRILKLCLTNLFTIARAKNRRT